MQLHKLPFVAAFIMMAAAAPAAAVAAQKPGTMPRAQMPRAQMSSAQKLRAADAHDWERILDAEIGRAATPAQLSVLLAGTHNPSVELRRISVRALGRLQRADLADSIARSLDDPIPAVRAEAAHALALASIADRSPADVREIVRNALEHERDPSVVGALAETLGRLRSANADSARIVAAQLTHYLGGAAAARLGAVRGLHFIARQPVAIRAGLDTGRTALIAVATAAGDGSASADHVRRSATEALAIAGLGDEQTALRILKDADPFVRREAVLMAALPARDTAAAHRIINHALLDPFWLVRFEALRQYGTRIASSGPCAAVAPFVHDASMHVRLEAIDILGSRCVADASTTLLLDSIVGALPAGADGQWHAAAHALVSLASRNPALAARHMKTFLSSSNLFVRTYAANAAAVTRDTALLRRLASDAHPNVRTAAVHGLSRLLHHDADAIYIDELQSDDSQLLIEAATALDSTSRNDVAPRLLDALDRVTRQMRENSRDGRMALLNTIAHVGKADVADRVMPYLHDFDPQVTARAATILKTWTGAEQQAAPILLAPEKLPTFADVAALSNARVHVEMGDGTVFDLRLLAFDAPINVSRFARLAEAGYFNGLSLHRVEPNFVVQGGSPNANEYTGAPRFSRDEIGYPNDRGTVGLSTRGHDTGDAQIFINTIDNTQLDPLYTVFAVVTRGMTAVDRILEGDVMKRVTVIR